MNHPATPKTPATPATPQTPAPQQAAAPPHPANDAQAASPTGISPAASLPDRITLPMRVRYVDCDPMGIVHHSIYPVWFELARTELLRLTGVSYRQLEESGTMIVVAKLNITYLKPARYDDLIHVTARIARAEGVRIEHEYIVEREGQPLCKGATTLACVDREGRIRPVPQFLLLPTPKPI